MEETEIITLCFFREIIEKWKKKLFSVVEQKFREINVFTK